ncbi:MAG: DUF72 domain-containing protein [Methylobacteriaceae bacterium]|nr:DUF72 domain-containing protein [Methylobacteriaceae bacterium]
MIRVGIGGWTFAPWRGPFYPPGLPHAQELAYAAGQVTAIEINGTFYRTQSPDSFAKWAAETPDGFVFTVKGHRSVTNRKSLAEAGESIAFFLDSGVAALGPKLGPILWQLAPLKRFAAADLEAFLRLLPPERHGIRLRHALEVRHPSFLDPAFAELAHRYAIPVVYADHESYAALADPSGDFVYARLQRAKDSEPAGYAGQALDAWADRARIWERGGVPADLPRVGTGAVPPPGEEAARDVFVFFIAGDKVRNPAAATALISRL